MIGCGVGILCEVDVEAFCVLGVDVVSSAIELDCRGIMAGLVKFRDIE
jgi:hypothetical protein